jgi:PAS domain S-box-containing protein
LTEIEEKAHFRSLFENAPGAYVVLHLDGRIHEVNHAFLQLSGLTREAALKKHFQSLLSPAGIIFYETQMLPVLLLQGFRNEIALDIIRAPDVRVPVLANCALQLHSDGSPRRIAVLMLQAAERRQFERDLLRSRKEAEQMAEVVLHSSDAIIAVQPQGHVKSWNKGSVDMFGYSASEVIGSTFADLIFPTQGRREVDAALESLREGREARLQTVGIHKDGRQIDISVSLTPHMEAPGTLVAFSAIIRDVSMQKLAERALLQNEKLASVGRLASSIAHEINNPLAAVTNLLYILESEVPTAELRRMVHTAQEELARVSQITTHTLRFHRQSSSPTEVNLSAFFTSVLALYRGRLGNADIQADIGRSNASPLFCHEGELRQIILNIVGNAVDSMRGGGKLMLRNRDATEWSTGRKGVRITIADTGTGIECAIVSRIFEPFFSTKGIGGAGLGLWVTQDLVQRNLGSIRLRSSTAQRHHGSVFCLFFPHRPELSQKPD